MQNGLVFSIQKYSIQDGPGIRTTVFLKGCPASCPWCHNPESQSRLAEILVHEERCLECGRCLEACPERAGTPEGGRAGEGDVRCIRCGACVEACPTEARKMAGREMSVAEVLREVLADRIFYDQSGGGVTFSGGEPLSQFPFLKCALEACREQGVHTAVDTCGHAPREQILAIAPLTDLFLYDLKLMDEARHLEQTGISNRIILENLRLLARSHKMIRIRVPIIPGVNDSEEDIAEMGRFVASLEATREIELLPYHQMGLVKSRRLGRCGNVEEFETPPRARMEELAVRLRSHGLDVKIGGKPE